MLASEIKNARRNLEAQLRGLRTGKDALADLAVEISPDICDEAQWRSGLEAAVQAVNSGTEISRRIEAALRHVQDGDYGICENCGEPIAAKRLQALPWATSCIRCQEELEGSRAG